MTPRPRRGDEATTPEPHVPVFVISVAAELTGLHPQTLRQYDRIGLVSPGRTGGGGRRYSWHDIEQLRAVARLTQAGIGLEGVRRILELEQEVEALRAHAADLARELDDTRRALADAHRPRLTPQSVDRLPVLRSSAAPGAVVVWRRGR